MKKAMLILVLGLLVSCSTSVNDNQIILEGYMVKKTDSGEIVHLLKLNHGSESQYIATTEEYFNMLSKPENIGRVYKLDELIPTQEYCPL